MCELHAAKTCLITSITILCTVGFNLCASATTLMKIMKTDYLIMSFAVERKADFDFRVVGSNSLSWVPCHFHLRSLFVSLTCYKRKALNKNGQGSSLPTLLFHSQCCRTNTDESHDDNEENNNEHWSRWRCSSVLPGHWDENQESPDI